MNENEKSVFIPKVLEPLIQESKNLKAYHFYLKWDNDVTRKK